MEAPATTEGPSNQTPLFPMSESDRERLVRLETQGKAYDKRLARIEKILMSFVGMILAIVIMAWMTGLLK